MSSLPPLLIHVYDKLILARYRLILCCLAAVIAFLGYKAKDFRLDASTQTLILDKDKVNEHRLRSYRLGLSIILY